MALDVIEGKIGMLELSPPVTFEPVGPVTTVFFDDKNQQVLQGVNSVKSVTTIYGHAGVLSSVWRGHWGHHKVSSWGTSNQPGIQLIIVSPLQFTRSRLWRTMVQ